MKLENGPSWHTSDVCMALGYGSVLQKSVVLVVWVKICVFTQLVFWGSKWQRGALRLKLFPVIKLRDTAVVLESH